MILFFNDSDPSMRFEGLARFAFENCGKKEDPWGYSGQEVYGAFVPKPTNYDRRALSTVLNKLIWDNRNFESLKDQLLKLEEKVWDTQDQEGIINIIDDTIKMFNE